MRTMETILLAAGMGRSVYSKWRIQRMLATLVTVAVLAVTAAAMISLLMICGLYAVYMSLLSQGITPMGGLLITAIVALLLTAGIVSLIRKKMCELKSNARTPVGDVANAFLDGLLS